MATEPRPDLADFLDNAPIPIHSVDTAGVIQWANRAELELLGYAPHEYIGQPIARFHTDRAALADMCARLVRGETLHDAPASLRCKDGSIRHFLISSNMQTAGGRRVASRCFLRDVTDTRRAEDERDRVIADLSRTVRLNDLFAGILGHDLRGPLSTVVMASQLLLGSHDDPKSVRALHRVLNSADRMQRMIDQLLDFARARADGGLQLERRPADVAELARDVIEEVRFARPAWRFELDTAGDTRGELDASRLQQVLANLVGNAAQHGEAGAPLEVTVDGRDPDVIRVSVANRGAMPAELIPILFSPTRRSHHKGPRSQGLGLGLFISDHIVRAHGGQIAVESADDRTVLRFELPRRAAGDSAVATFEPAVPPSSDRIPTAGLAEASLAFEATHAHLVAEAARHHEDRIRLLVDSIKDYAIFMLDADGHIATWNTGAQRIKGYSAGEIVGQHFAIFHPPEDAAAGTPDRELARVQAEGRIESEGWRLRKDGTRFWAHVVTSALRDDHGALLGYAKITRDLTEQHKLEAERLALAHAQEAVRLRDEFLSLASHELKTPLTVLQLQLDALRERAEDGPTVAKLERSGRAVGRLTELIEALLDVSRIASGRFQLRLERLDIADVVAVAVDRLHESAVAAGCRIALSADHAVGLWDRSRIDQVVSNLVANAIRYAAGAPIEVCVRRAADGVEIEVRDRGPGLPDGMLVRIFERFERAASMRHYGGLGLGLYLVREITEAHGGCVAAENNAGGAGACFTVRLPVAAEARA